MVIESPRFHVLPPFPRVPERDETKVNCNMMELIVFLISFLAPLLMLRFLRKCTSRGENGSGVQSSKEPWTWFRHLLLIPCAVTYQKPCADDRNSNGADQHELPLFPSVNSTWKEPCNHDRTFVHFLSGTFLLWQLCPPRHEHEEDAQYVFGKGSAGIGLYSYETRDAFRILYHRLKKEEDKLQRQRMAHNGNVLNDDLQRKLVELVRMLAYVKSRRNSSGPNLPIHPDKLYERLSRLSHKHHLSLEVVANADGSSFSLGHPEFPDYCTGIFTHRRNRHTVQRVQRMETSLNTDGDGVDGSTLVSRRVDLMLLSKLVFESTWHAVVSLVARGFRWGLFSLQTFLGGYTLSVYKRNMSTKTTNKGAKTARACSPHPKQDTSVLSSRSETGMPGKIPNVSAALSTSRNHRKQTTG